MPAKFVLVPGWTTNDRTGNREFLTVQQLAQLYKLKPGTWAAVNDRVDVDHGIAEAEKAGATVLRPRYDGKYELPDGVTRELDNQGTGGNNGKGQRLQAETGDTQGREGSPGRKGGK